MTTPDDSLADLPQPIWDLVEKSRRTPLFPRRRKGRHRKCDDLAEQIADAIAAAVRSGYELNYDGSEDPTRAAYVEGLRDAWGIALSFTASAHGTT